VSAVIEKCSCEESQHLRVALTMIHDIATGRTRGGAVGDLAIIGNLAAQALALKRLEGDPAVYPLEGYVLGNV
jgi:hypothetical protein